MTSQRKKIEIINVNLDIDIDAEIKKQSTIDHTTRAKINNIVNRAKIRTPDKKISQKDVEWNDKFEKLFQIMAPLDSLLPLPDISKETVVSILEITADQLGAILTKFKKFLRESKLGKFVVIIGNSRHKRTYALKRFS
jgi:hypothetical protein